MLILGVFGNNSNSYCSVLIIPQAVSTDYVYLASTCNTNIEGETYVTFRTYKCFVWNFTFLCSYFYFFSGYHSITNSNSVTKYSIV